MRSAARVGQRASFNRGNGISSIRMRKGAMRQLPSESGDERVSNQELRRKASCDSWSPVSFPYLG